MYLQYFHYSTRNLQKDFQDRSQIMVPKISSPLKPPTICKNSPTPPPSKKKAPLCGHQKLKNPYLKTLRGYFKAKSFVNT